MKARRLLCDALLFDPEAPRPAPGALLLEAGRIAACFAAGDALPDDAERVSLAGAGLAPGLIDLHHHGRLPFDDPEALGSGLRATAASLLRHGVTAFLPTTIAWSRAALRARVDALVPALDVGASGAAPIGIHLEGPWIRAEAAGAQPLTAIRPYDPREGADLLARAAGTVRLVTLAPEVPGAAALEDELARRGVAVAIGHTLAESHVIEESIGRGARHATHVFNAMGPLHQRGPGVAAAVLADDRLSCDLVADGVHVHPDWARIAARAKGEGLILVSDAVHPPDGGGFGAGPLRLHAGAWRLPDGRLAGSALTLERAVANAVAWGATTRLEAVAACTLRPARLLGIEAERGTLRPGARADLVALDAEFRVVRTWLGGEPAAGR